MAQNGELSRRVTREFLYDRLKEIQNKMNEDTTKKKKGILRIGKNDKSAKKAER